MVDVSRRSFLRGVLAVSVVAATAKLAIAEHIPTLYGDGMHDDAPALNALFSGKPFRVDNETIVASDGQLNGGSFAIKSTVHIRSNSFTVRNCRIECVDGFEGETAIHVHKECNDGLFENMHLNGRGLCRIAALSRDY